jgi:hypothetical protein
MSPPWRRVNHEINNFNGSGGFRLEYHRQRVSASPVV